MKILTEDCLFLAPMFPEQYDEWLEADTDLTFREWAREQAALCERRISWLEEALRDCRLEKTTYLKNDVTPIESHRDGR
jgi:hypothetical protein